MDFLCNLLYHVKQKYYTGELKNIKRLFFFLGLYEFICFLLIVCIKMNKIISKGICQRKIIESLRILQMTLF